MKVDDEAQREQLLGLLSTVEFTVTAPTIQQTGVMIFGLLDKVRQAGLEKQIVPIESLAPDPPDLRLESG
jgi:hypothetical protein